MVIVIQILAAIAVIVLVVDRCTPLTELGHFYGDTADCHIKGNISITSRERIYHVPGGEWYDETRIERAKGERWFCSEEEARRAGWRRSYQ